MTSDHFQGTIRSIIILCIALLVGGCGGSGGGDGSSSTGSYSGLTSPAPLTEKNAQDILEDAYYGGLAGSGMASPLSAMKVEGVEGTGPLNMQQTAMLIKDLVEQERSKTTVQTSPYASAVETEPIHESGKCGGVVTGSIQVNDVTGSLTGNLTFSNYCEMGVLLSGAVTFAGQIDVESGELAMTMTFRNFNEVIGDESMNIILNGTLDMATLGTSIHMTMDIFMQDETSGKSFLMDGYTTTMAEQGGYSEAEVYGRFYCSDYGYVNLSTEETIMVSENEDYPSQGVFVATGENGSSARLTFLNFGAYSVDVDEDGNGVYEFNSGIQYWDN
jgi:hypothetical protein